MHWLNVYHLHWGEFYKSTPIRPKLHFLLTPNQKTTYCIVWEYLPDSSNRMTQYFYVHKARNECFPSPDFAQILQNISEWTFQNISSDNILGLLDLWLKQKTSLIKWLLWIIDQGELRISVQLSKMFLQPRGRIFFYFLDCKELFWKTWTKWSGKQSFN